ncbi:serine--tRNA synthetase-like protein Slimp [Periplaneta americana]|uniref:serine--tRNA synthetase-like protein Slimp n=1 Tax=Periplaneta americana TaxID=6978 RepID=UPI0037E948FA
MAVVIRRLFQSTVQYNRLWHRYYGSALYVTGDKAKEMFTVLSPHIDIEERFRDTSTLKQNIELRGMQINVDNIKQIWEMLKSIENDKKKIESQRIKIANKMKELRKTSTDINEDVENLKLVGKLLRDDLKTTMKAIWELEKKVISKVLSLPNDLHPDTPNKEAKVISQFESECNSKQTESHVEIGKKLDVLEYNDPMCYFLKGDAAIFELSVLNFFTEKLCTGNSNFIKCCNSDFTRSVVVEGCGLNHEDPNATFILKDIGDILDTNDVNRLHLTGGASLPSFCAFHAKQIIPVSAFPLRLVATGRQYSPNIYQLDKQNSGLFDVCQASCVEIFISTTDQREMADEFGRVIEAVTSIYKELSFPFRVVYLPANQLKSYESLKASFQMYSSHLQTFMEVGHISLCDDYISKRLLIQYGTDTEHKFPFIVSGTVISVPKLLGCVLEVFGTIPMPKLGTVNMF